MFSNSNSQYSLSKKRPQILGTTFSHLQCNALNLDYREVFENVLRLEFNVIRLCAYWSDIEQNEGKLDFSALDYQFDELSKYPKTEVILSVGMKVPRWPEFHFPQWVQDRYATRTTHKPVDSDRELSKKALEFIHQVVYRYKNNKQIAYWQVENECLSTLNSDFDRYLSLEYLKQEVDLVKKTIIWGKIMLTHSIYLLPFYDADNKAFQYSRELGEAHGFNVYTKVPIKGKVYLSPTPLYWNKLKKWLQQLRKEGREAWITELQAEPWEQGNSIHIGKMRYPSASPEQTIRSIRKLTSIGYQNILLWGVEYWYWQRKQGVNDWWIMADNLVNE